MHARHAHVVVPRRRRYIAHAAIEKLRREHELKTNPILVSPPVAVPPSPLDPVQCLTIISLYIGLLSLLVSSVVSFIRRIVPCSARDCRNIARNYSFIAVNWRTGYILGGS